MNGPTLFNSEKGIGRIARRLSPPTDVLLRASVLLSLWLAPAALSCGQEPAAPHLVRLAPSDSGKANAPDDSLNTQWYPDAVLTLEGSIATFDGDQLAITLPGESIPTRYASRRVLEIELRSVPADQKAALDQFAQRQYSESLRSLIQSISAPKNNQRPPVWRQQALSMLAAQAASRSGRGEIALELVKQLDARPLPALITGRLPIDWTGSTAADSPLIQAAVQQASSPSPAVKLVAASWLLKSPQYTAAATEALKRLGSQSERPAIASLARQLLWRTKSPPEIQSGLSQWESEVRRLPMALQTGPMICLQVSVRRAGLIDAAKKWKLILESAPSNWHPDLPPTSATER